MNVRSFVFVVVSLLIVQLRPIAEVRIVAERSTTGSSFTFKSVPPPASNDAASAAQFTIVDGERDPNGGDLGVLHDGRMPSEADEPGANFLLSFDADGGKYQFTIDATLAPDLRDWADKELKPVVQEWYSKVVAMLPSDGFQPRTNITLRFRTDMGGTPASAGGAGINLNTGWFRKELKREARGSVVHEMVHVVQSYGGARRTNPNATRTPGWLVEGMADYIRWFLYEPQTHGAEITARNIARAKYDASYRVTGNFLNWVTQTYDHDIVRKLNAAARKGEYTPQLWKDWTGKTVQELGDEWLKANQERLQSATTDGNTTPGHAR